MDPTNTTNRAATGPNRAERRRYLHDSGLCAFHSLQIKRGTERCMRCRKRGSRVVATARRAGGSEGGQP